METPNQPSLSRMALGALDVNKHLNSPHTSPKKSPAKNRGFVFDDNAERPATYSLKEQLLEASFSASFSASRPASPARVASASPSRNEKRKAGPTSIFEDAEDVLRHAKHARVEEHTAAVYGYMQEPEVVDAAILLSRTDEDEEPQPSQGTVVHARSPSASFDISQDDTQLTAVTEPDIAQTSAGALPVPPALAPPTETELRENAAALRLRLKFAMYKLKTNQLDLPLSRLEFLSPSSPPKPIPSKSSKDSQLADGALPNNQHSAPGSSPDSATPRPPRHNVLASSTTPSASPSKEGTRMEPATPLPLYIQSNAGTPGHGDDLTSSVVQGRAADGLLSLMGIRT